jgi:soluble lytic murein transglycosylase-like protein
LKGLRSLFFAPVAIAVAAWLSPLPPAHAQAKFANQSPSEQYLTLRRLYPPRPGLTPQILGADPNTYRGMTLELEGTLSGVVRAGDDGALLMLTTERYGHLNLTMSLLPTWIQPGARLRVLVVAMGAPEGEIVAGTPDMQVVAVASASDIGAAELEIKQKDAARAEQERQRDAARYASRSLRSSRSGYALTGRTFTNVLQTLSPAAQGAFPKYRDFILRWNSRLSDGEANAITASILTFSERYDVDPRLMVALIIAESDFRPGITSHAGAMGIAQLMPDEVQRLGLTNPYDPVQNIAGATFLIKERLCKYSGSGSYRDADMRQILLAIASYNAGMGAVKKYGGVPPYRETQNYVKKIEQIYRQLCQYDNNDSGAGST